MAIRTERSEVRTKTTEGQYSPVRLELARLVSSLLCGTRTILVLSLPAFENKKYTAYDRFHGNGPYGEIPTKNLPCHIIITFKSSHHPSERAMGYVGFHCINVSSIQHSVPHPTPSFPPPPPPASFPSPLPQFPSIRWLFVSSGPPAQLIIKFYNLNEHQT